MSQVEEKLYSEIKGTYVFAKAKDYLGNWHYLAAENEEQIEKYCEEYSPQGTHPHINNGLAIEVWINYVDPIQVCFFFTWVGQRYNPFVVAKPFNYDSNKKYKWTPKVRTVGPSMKTSLVEEEYEEEQQG